MVTHRRRSTKRDGVPPSVPILAMFHESANGPEQTFLPLMQRLRKSSEIDERASHGAIDLESFRAALRISLYRLPERQRAVITRYYLDRQPVEEISVHLAVSRRQFFRDHRAAITKLATLLASPQEAESSRAGVPTTPVAVLDRADISARQIRRSLAEGLRNAGAWDDALSILRQSVALDSEPDQRSDTLLEIAELAVDRGDLETCRETLRQHETTASPQFRSARARPAVQRAYVEAQLVESHRERQRLLEGGARTLRVNLNDHAATERITYVKVLHALSISYDHCGRWAASRNAAAEASRAARGFAIADSPLGLVVDANYAMRDARQFGIVDEPVATLRRCLSASLRNGWVQTASEMAVHFMNLNLTRSQYVKAIEWHQWISAVDAARLTARSRNSLNVDLAHALTMLRKPEQALASLGQGDDQGLAFRGSRNYWRAEALLATGDATKALAVASETLELAVSAGSRKGQARSTRIAALCHHALGHGGPARKVIADCLDLSECYVSPYDFLLTIAAAGHIGYRRKEDARELARILSGSKSDAHFDPPRNGQMHRSA